jgi:hypothetical protein
MRKQPEPLNELFLQQFPRKDPIELEQITKTVEKWLLQKRQQYEKDIKKIANKFGEDAQQTRVSRNYLYCIDELLYDIDPHAYPMKT